MKIALLNDTHFGCRNDSPAFMKYQNRFYEELFFPYLVYNNITTLIHLGDVVDSINGQANQPIEAFVIAQNVTDSQEAQSYINNQRTL